MNSVAIPASAPAPAFNAEADLVRSAARGDADAFEELFRRHSEPAWRLAQAVAPDRDAARDALRDGFVRALRSTRTPRRHAGHPMAFRPEVLGAVYKSAVDQAYDRSAAPAARRPHTDPTLALADAAFRSLPERWRAAVWLSEVESMDVDRIAPIMGVSNAVASQLTIRGKRGLAGRFSQAGHEVPEHPGQLLRAVALPTPAKLMEDTRVRFAAAGSERGPILAPVAGWLEERAVRPMSVAVGALVGLGLIGLGVVPQGSALRSELGASAAGSLAGAVPVQTCLGLPCSGGAGTSTTARSALGVTGGSTVAGLLGGAGGFGSNPGGSGSSGGSGAGGSAPASTGTPAVTTSGGATSPTSPASTATQSPGGGSTPSGSSPSGSSPSGGTGPTTKAPAPSTVISVAPVASVTSTGSALNVNLLPTSSGTAPVTATVGGCSTIIGVTVGSTTLGCSSTGSSSTSTGGTSTSSTDTSTSGSTTTSGSTSTSTSTSPTSTSSTSSGLSTTISGVTSTVGNTLTTLTSGL